MFRLWVARGRKDRGAGVSKLEASVEVAATTLCDLALHNDDVADPDLSDFEGASEQTQRILLRTDHRGVVDPGSFPRLLVLDQRLLKRCARLDTERVAFIGDTLVPCPRGVARPLISIEEG